MSEKEIKMMRSMRECGVSLSKISKVMDCSITTVYCHTSDCKVPGAMDWHEEMIHKIHTMKPPKDTGKEMRPCEHCQWRKNKEPIPICAVCYREVLKNGV